MSVDIIAVMYSGIKWLFGNSKIGSTYVQQ
jgi:hypothetical protein